MAREKRASWAKPVKCWGVHNAAAGTYAIYIDKGQALEWVAHGAHGTLLVPGTFVPIVDARDPRCQVFKGKGRKGGKRGK